MISWYMDSSCITRPSTSRHAEEFLRLPDSVRQRVDLVVRVVNVEACPGAGLGTQRAVQRPGTVVPGSDGYAQLIQHLPHIVRMNPVHHERYCHAPVLGRQRPEYPEPADAGQCLQRVRGERLLVRGDLSHTQALEVVTGSGQADGLRGRGHPGLESL